MRAVLISVIPMRGSSIRIPQPNCIDFQCFQASLEMQWDGYEENWNIKMSYQFWWSLDGVAPHGGSLGSGSMEPGAGPPRILGPRIMNEFVPNFLLVKMWHEASSADGVPYEEGWAAFKLGYNPM
ncbi:MAG TPA: hypothetical protein VJJ72_00885 [Candidatus Paceibacterota bacterium]